MAGAIKLDTCAGRCCGVVAGMIRRLLLSLLVCAVPAWACSVPVFRYALEHWKPDAFEAVVTSREPLGAEALRALEKSGANLAVRTVVDATALDPRVSIRFPRTQAELWSGALAGVEQVLDSPARREIVKRIGEGQSAVWVLLESGDPARDDATAKAIEERLDYLASTLALPKLEAQDIAKGLVSIAQEDLRLEFSTLRVSRDDAAERVFIAMLLGLERGLAESREPMVFPVFGRGRALYALVGEGIKRETIDRAATFLIGKCSCEVKEQNPGADLLLVADWDAAVKAKAAPLPDLPTLAELAQTAPETVTISGETTPKPAERSTFSAPDAVVIGVALLLLALGSYGVRFWRK